MENISISTRFWEGKSQGFYASHIREPPRMNFDFSPFLPIPRLASPPAPLYLIPAMYPKLPASLAPIALLALASLAQADTLKIDPVHSTVGFKIRHLFANVTGRFTDVSGAIDIDPAHPENASVTATIGIASIDTANAMRDKDLRGSNFFESEKFPTMTFKSTKVDVTGQSADVTGDLTLHGITKPVTLHVTFLGKGPGMMGGVTTGWEATTSLKRSDFGLTWSKTIEGTQLVGDDVSIDLEITADAK
jgi:polyisoprenoid-binding protein YceI